MFQLIRSPFTRRKERRVIEDALRRYGRSLTAPPDVKRAGLERVRAEFERQAGQ